MSITLLKPMVSAIIMAASSRTKVMSLKRLLTSTKNLGSMPLKLSARLITTSIAIGTNGAAILMKWSVDLGRTKYEYSTSMHCTRRAARSGSELYGSLYTAYSCSSWGFLKRKNMLVSLVRFLEKS